MNSEQRNLQIEHIFLDKLIRQVDKNNGYLKMICEALEIKHNSSLMEILVAIGELKDNENHR